MSNALEGHPQSDVSSSLFINGEWTAADNREVRDIINPFNQEVIAKVPEAGMDEVERAITAARHAFDTGSWPETPAADRGQLLYRLAERIDAENEYLAKLETLNTGKTLVESRADMSDIANVFRYFAGIADKSQGEVIASPIPDTSSVVVREPIGVCALITPWNYPLLQASWKLAPALATGCTMIIKPSENTPLTTIAVIRMLDDLRLPKGVVNLVLGAGNSVGQRLAESTAVDLVSFTGGGVTGRKIMQAATSNFKRVALELGGKNPNIVFADADFDTAVDYALNAVFYHAGQVCSAGARLLVQAPWYDAFIDALKERIARVKLGDGLDEATQMGPLISADHLAKVERYVEIGKEEGARLVMGGQRATDAQLKNGFFYMPTLFVDCDVTMRIVQEETFGPILTVEKFDTEDEAIQLANSTVYGLAGAVWTNDTNRAHRVSKALRMGTVWINDFHPYFPQAPWGGYKQSGIGRELGHSGVEEYTEQKHILQNHNPSAQQWFGV